MSTGGSYNDPDGTGGTDDQQIVRFQRVGNTNVVELELEDGGTAAIDLTFLLTGGVTLCDAFGNPRT